ncbi:MAG: DUF11 domain-containing protein [Anaerolineales bacterium]|nr:DUF11 domain-containing protein [Anaerolineales bacterium]
MQNTAVISESQTGYQFRQQLGERLLPTTRNIDVYVIKSAVAAADPAVPGTQIQYTLVYGNNGADPATDVVLTDTLPMNTSLVAGSIRGGCRQASKQLPTRQRSRLRRRSPMRCQTITPSAPTHR